MALVALDAGHGGSNPGAIYNGRQEKDDVLDLVLSVGYILEANGTDVYYTRTTDIYESPYQKAQEANEIGADYFVSIHRNSSPYPNQYSGVETLVYNRYGEAEQLAENINDQLEQVGFANLGVNERPNLVVLNSTQMPSVLVEVGFINTDADNELFDERFEEIAQAIADGILVTIWNA
jgi:N-acetylmuramoyl-L-alanine amidase